jgi:hypothetical protein
LTEVSPRNPSEARLRFSQDRISTRGMRALCPCGVVWDGGELNAAPVLCFRNEFFSDPDPTFQIFSDPNSDHVSDPIEIVFLIFLTQILSQLYSRLINVLGCLSRRDISFLGDFFKKLIFFIEHFVEKLSNYIRAVQIRNDFSDTDPAQSFLSDRIRIHTLCSTHAYSNTAEDYIQYILHNIDT